jgi:hypothetical protein
VEGQTETQEVRNQEDEPEVRAYTESREPNKERLESNQIKIDEVRDQNEHIELTEEREEGEVIDSENQNEGKNSEQDEKQNTFAHLLDFLPLVSQSVLPHYLRIRQYSDCLTTNGRQKVVNLSRILSPHQYCPVAPQKVLYDC